MANSDRYKSQMERLEREIDRAEDRRRDLIRKYERSSGDALDRIRSDILDVEGDIRSLKRDFDSAKRDFESARWEEIRKR